MYPSGMNPDRLVLILAIVISAGLHLPGRADEKVNWPQFRGEGGRGIAADAKLPDHWSVSENVAWKVEIPGQGWSSPVVWGDRVFLTTAVSSGQTEAPKKGLYLGGERRDLIRPEHEWKVLCLDLASGKTVWEHVVYK